MNPREMRFLVDVGVGRAVEKLLVNRGYEVKTIRSLDPRMTDIDIIRLAVSEERMVITMDKDFGELVYHASEKHCGVLLLRMGNSSAGEKTAVVSYILDHYAQSIYGNFCVYHNSRLRIRRSLHSRPY